MGLLDEAIREHLELKRRRGADPSLVARTEREALEPVFEDHAAMSEETAELDMRSVIGEESVTGADPSSPDGPQGHFSFE